MFFIILMYRELCAIVINPVMKITNQLDKKCPVIKKHKSNGWSGYELHDISTRGYTTIPTFMSTKDVFKRDRETDERIHSQIHRLGEPLPDMTDVCGKSTSRPFFYPSHPRELFRSTVDTSKKQTICDDDSFRLPDGMCYPAWGNIQTTIPDNIIGDTRTPDTFFCDTSGERFHNNRQKLPLYAKQSRVSAYDQLIDQFSCNNR
jgi:hypothetical protein